MSHSAGVLEVWEFLGRFSGVLQLAEVPSLSELATAMAKPGPDSRDPFNSAMVRSAGRPQI